MPVRNRSCSFAPASRNTQCELNETKKNKLRILKQRIKLVGNDGDWACWNHVPRHIELTAVLREILKQKNKSNRIDRFEKTTRPSVK